MDSKIIILQLGTDILLMLISIFAIYYGIREGIAIIWMIGAFLLLISIIRLVIFVKTFLKHGDE